MMDREVSNILIDSRDLSNTKNPLFNNSNLKFSNRSILNVQNFDVCIHRTIYSFEFFHFYRSQQKHPSGPGKTTHTHIAFLVTKNKLPIRKQTSHPRYLPFHVLLLLQPYTTVPTNYKKLQHTERMPDS